MEKRPLSLTIIAWFVLLGALLGIYAAATMQSNAIAMQMLKDAGMSLRFSQTMNIVGGIISIVCAYGIFKAQPWSRVLYVGWSIIGLCIGFFTSPSKSLLIFTAVFIAVVAFFLFRPAADRWFAAKGLQLQRTDA